MRSHPALLKAKLILYILLGAAFCTAYLAIIGVVSLAIPIKIKNTREQDENNL